MTQKLIEVNDLSSGQYSVNKNLKCKTSLLRLDLCDYIDPYIVLKRTITVSGYDDDKERERKNDPITIVLHLDHV